MLLQALQVVDASAISGRRKQRNREANRKGEEDEDEAEMGGGLGGGGEEGWNDRKEGGER